MALTLGDNFSYQGAKPLDGRLKYDTVANMKAVADATMYDGCLAYCVATDKTYQWKSTNTVDSTTGRWREFETGGGGTSDYADLENKPQINSHTLTGNQTGADLGLQNTTLSSPITIDGEEVTTVEGAISALNNVSQSSVPNRLTSSSNLNVMTCVKARPGITYYNYWVSQGNASNAPTGLPITIPATADATYYIDVIIESCDSSEHSELAYKEKFICYVRKITSSADELTMYQKIYDYLSYGGQTSWTKVSDWTLIGEQSITAGTGLSLSNNEMSIKEFESGDLDEVMSPLPSSASKYMNYSTEEQVVGQWIDGKTIYQKTINFGALAGAGSSRSVAHGISNLGTLVELKSTWYQASVSSNPNRGDLSCPVVSGSSASACQMIVNDTNITCFCTANLTNISAYVTVQYTKE